MGNQKVSDDELGAYSRVELNLRTLVTKGVRPARATTQLVQAIADGKLSMPSAPDLTDFEAMLSADRFTPPELQIAKLRQWNEYWDEYFYPHQIHIVLTEVPSFRWWLNDHIALVLCWTHNTLEQTIESYLTALRIVYGDLFKVECYGDTSLEQIALQAGTPTFEANQLWWEMVDLTANKGKAINDVDPRKAAGLQVFAVACQHPALFQAEDGIYLNVSGLSVDTPDESGSVDIYNDGKGYSIRLQLDPESGSDPLFTNPEIVG